MVTRYDFQHIGRNVKTTPQGFLIIPAYTARTGLQTYLKEDGKPIVEYRADAEVFSDLSMSSLRTAAVTNKHPVKMVCPKTAKEFIVGHTDGVIEKKEEDGEGYLATKLVITHQDAIDSILKGRCELSNGYTCDLEFESGDYKGEKYDARQVNIVNNHIALVDRGRAGRNVRLKLDSMDAIINDEEQEEKTMKIKIGQKEFDVADDLGNAIKDQMTTNETAIAAAKADADNVRSDLTKVTGEKNTLVAKVDSLESDLVKAKSVTPKMDAAEINVLVKERVSIIETGSKMLDAETVKKLDSMSNEEIKVAVIKADSPEADAKKLEQPAYVDARFDHICEGLKGSDKSKENLGKQIVKQKTDAEIQAEKDAYVSPAQARENSMKADQEDSAKKTIGLTKETVK